VREPGHIVGGGGWLAEELEALQRMFREPPFPSHSQQHMLNTYWRSMLEMAGSSEGAAVAVGVVADPWQVAGTCMDSGVGPHISVPPQREGREGDGRRDRLERPDPMRAWLDCKSWPYTERAGPT
jgi:hypothetical protein